MKAHRLRTVLGVLALLATLAACSSTNANAVVVRTIVVETSDVDAYRRALDEGWRIMRELGVTPTLHVESPAIERGPGPAKVRLVIEYPDRTTRAQWSALLSASERFQAWYAAQDALRRVISDEERELASLGAGGERQRPSQDSSAQTASPLR